MLRFSRVPDSVSVSKFHAQLVALFPLLSISSLAPPSRDKDACEIEAIKLRQLGPKGTRERTSFLTGLVGGVECAEETGIFFGANFTLWFASPEAARAAAMSIDGKEMSGSGLRAHAVAESSIEVIFSSDVLQVLQADVHAAIDRLKASSDASGGRLAFKTRRVGGGPEGKREKALIVTVSGADGVAIAGAQRELEALQRGTLIAITTAQKEARAAQREKIFPNPRREPRKAAAVNDFLRKLQDEHKCLIHPLFAAGNIRVVGRTSAATAVGARVVAYLAETPFEATFHFPRHRMREMKEFLDKQSQGAAAAAPAPVKFKVEGGSVLLSSRDENAFVEARRELAEFISSMPSTRTVAECCVCFDPVKKSLQTCSHSSMCDACAAQYVSSEVGENRFPLHCAECNESLLSEDVAAMSEDLDGVHAASVAAFVLEHKEFGYCSTPDCRQILDRRQPSATCGICQRVQCPLCGEAPHAGETCDDAARRLAFLNSPEGAASIVARKLIVNYLAPYCPQCGTAFLDFSGCFALTCGACQGGICGFCLEGTGKVDSHDHTVDCKWYFDKTGKKSLHFGGTNPLTFQQCMRMRLPELAASYLLQALPLKTADGPDLRRYAADAASPLMRDAEWFDEGLFRKLARLG
jgi:hypothetical protein